MGKRNMNTNLLIAGFFLLLVFVISQFYTASSSANNFWKYQDSDSSYVVNNNNINCRNNKDNDNDAGDDVVLHPPFRILQLGPPRTATTFQFHLLSTLVKLKAPPDPPDSNRKEKTTYTYTTRFGRVRNNLNIPNHSFVIKSHVFKSRELSEAVDSGISLFATSYGSEAFKKGKKSEMDEFVLNPNSNQTVVEKIIYTQYLDQMLQCSLCEVDRYRKIFDLTDEEYMLVRTYMSYWEKIRKCCGRQSSKYHMYYIHGCDMSQFMQLPGYPMCEHYNMTQVELDYTSSKLYDGVDPDDDSKPRLKNLTKWTTMWRGVGDCARIDAKYVKEKLFFNDGAFKVCPSPVAAKTAAAAPSYNDASDMVIYGGSRPETPTSEKKKKKKDKRKSKVVLPEQ